MFSGNLNVVTSETTDPRVLLCRKWGANICKYTGSSALRRTFKHPNSDQGYPGMKNPGLKFRTTKIWEVTGLGFCRICDFCRCSYQGIEVLLIKFGANYHEGSRRQKNKNTFENLKIRIVVWQFQSPQHYSFQKRKQFF